LLFGVKVLSEPHLQASFGLTTHAQLQTMMFLQLVGGGQLLLFITRTENWFFQRPYPAAPLLGAIAGTQLTAALMCGFGLLVPAISWTLIGWVWLYVATWMFILGGVRLVYDRFASQRTARRQKHLEMVNQSLQPHVPAA
jgi:H+-transporting ATPase